MLPRWCNEVYNLNGAFAVMHRIVQKSKIMKGGRGAKPKHSVEEYSMIIALKEMNNRNLREAEEHLTKYVCKERIDHSVLSYWENKEEMSMIIAQFISIAGAMLQKYLSSEFTFVDSTKFTGWNVKNMKLVEVTVCNKICNQTVYPVGISFLRGDVVSPVREAVPKGTGKIKADAWYDEIETIKLLFKKGYIPIICPNKSRYSGYYRRKAREIYKMPENKLAYRQRGRGESVFGSLTNEHGDRLKARNRIAIQTRIAVRVFAYQIKLLIRCQLLVLLLIVRHALFNISINLPKPASLLTSISLYFEYEDFNSSGISSSTAFLENNLLKTPIKLSKSFPI